MEDWHFMFGLLITLLSLCGVAINSSALVILTRKRRLSIFHQLIRILSVYDLLVVTCGALSYGLPNVWPLYNTSVLPSISPFLMPVVHMALMVSVYCTVLISFERYIRICYLCQLRDSRLVTDNNILYYKLAILIFPVVFYLPKFFEVRWEDATLNYNVTVDCSRVILRAFATGDMSDVADALNESNSTTTLLGSCLQLSATMGLLNVSLVVQKSRRFVEVVPTALRRSPVYYKVYCVLLNTLLGALLPLAALFYLNVSTVRALRKMQTESDFSPVPTVAEVSTAAIQQPDSEQPVTTTTISPVHNNARKSFVFRNPSARCSKFLRWKREEEKKKKKTLHKSDHNVAIGSDCQQTDWQGLKSSSPNYVILNIAGDEGGDVQDEMSKKKKRRMMKKKKNPPTSYSCIFLNERDRFGGGGGVASKIDLGRRTWREMSKSYDALPRSNSSAGVEKSSLVAIAISQGSVDQAERNESAGNEDEEEGGTRRTREGNGGIRREAALKLPKLDLTEATSVASVALTPAPASSSASTRRRQPRQAQGGPGSSTSSSCSQRQERRLARISISIVWLFTFCHAWKAVPTIYESWHSEDGLDLTNWPFWLVIVEHISHSLIMFNSAVNFLIYVLS